MSPDLNTPKSEFQSSRGIPLEWRPWLRAGVVAALSLTLSFAAVWATPGGAACQKFSSAQDALMMGGKLALNEDIQVASDVQFAVFQGGQALSEEGLAKEDQPVRFLWVDQKPGSRKNLDAKRVANIGAQGKEYPHCIYDKSCRYVAFPLYEEGASGAKLKTLICENRKQALSMEDVKSALGPKIEISLAPPPTPEAGVPSVDLMAENKYCREAALAAAQKPSSNRAPASQ